MIVLSNSTAQTLSPGQSMTFDEFLLHTGCGECWRKNTGSVKLRSNGVYEIHFSANVDGATAEGPVELALSLGDAAMPETTMISSVTGVNNVATATAIKNCCGDYDRVSVKNTGTTTVTISANPVLYIKRVS